MPAKRSRPLSIEPAAPRTPPAPPPSRGRLWYDHEIPAQFFNGLPGIEHKIRWVRSHLPRASRIKIGRWSAWYQTDIEAYLEQERGRAPQAASA
jgi:hypothetical protein